jgi:hypothetical protein
MATVIQGERRPERVARRAERYNADMRLWTRLLIWATRNCAR